MQQRAARPEDQDQATHRRDAEDAGQNAATSRTPLRPTAYSSAGMNVDGLSESTAAIEMTRATNSTVAAELLRIPRVALRRVPARVLILTASVGEGHDRPALWLAEQLRAEQPETVVLVEDSLRVMGRVVATLSEAAPRVMFYRLRWFWDFAFWAVTGRRRPARPRRRSSPGSGRRAC